MLACFQYLLRFAYKTCYKSDIQYVLRFNSFALLQWLTRGVGWIIGAHFVLSIKLFFASEKVIHNILIKQPILTAKYNHLPFFSSKRRYHLILPCILNLNRNHPPFILQDLCGARYNIRPLLYVPGWLSWQSPVQIHVRKCCLIHPLFSQLNTWNHLPWKWLIRYKLPESASTVPINLSNRN